MDYAPFVKKLQLPPGFDAPATLTYEDIVATALSRSDLHDDVRGINSSLELIARTRGGGWPTGPVDDDFNYIDLVWHEQEFREQVSFAYVVRDAGGDYLGCAYLYPVGRRALLSEALLDRDVDVSWWVTGPAYDRGYYDKLYRALGRWVVEDFPFSAPLYSNAEIP
jgi:hypothetical protein